MNNVSSFLAKRPCRCTHPYREHDSSGTNPASWACTRPDCGCRRFVEQLDGATETSGTLASLICRLGMWCAQQKNKNFTATTDEVEAWVIEVGKAGVPIQEALEDFLIVKMLSGGSISSRMKDLTKPHRGAFKKEVELFVQKYRVLLAEHVLVS